MRLRLRQLVVMALIGVICAHLLSGCTVLGLGAGAIVDQARSTRYDAHPRERVTETSLKTPVVLMMLDGTQIAGRYLGVEPDETADGAAPTEPATDPSTQRIAILLADGPITQVLVDSIASLAVAAPKHGKLVGAGLGACIDIWIVVYFAAFAKWD